MRQPLSGDMVADVVIVGAGFTGLWTAYALLGLDPSLRVVVLEARHAGFGASGRNGGWLSGLLPGPREVYARRGGRAGVLALERAARDGVDDVIKVCAEEGIDADVVKGGTTLVAVTAAQRRRLEQYVATENAWGNGDLGLVDDPGVRVAGLHAAAWTPHCARVHPGKLVRGLAAAVVRRGALVFERTTARTFGPPAVATDHGTVRAPAVITATEGFTARLAGHRRDVLPMNSSMIVTAPLPGSMWDEIGWEHSQTLADMAHVFVYAQRTADGRIALGGRGVPYRFGSRFDPAGATPAATVAELTAALHRLFPVTSRVRVERAWSGVLGVARDWCATVAWDPSAGVGTAGGYAGDGLTTSYLAGRTLADLVLGRSTELTALPWVGRSSRRWEPEPLRFLGVRGAYAAYRAADRTELAHPDRATTPPTARLADLVSRR